ncbi:MAG: hypothetical protein P1V20_14845 [Verrucomicrobiales bacterium]|nr:hypothetical protein [Verrucomicrobiales bacterium]
MSLTNTIKKILVKNPEGLSPREIVEIIKERYPELYGTVSHRSNVEKGDYSDVNHALTAQIYAASRSGSFEVDRSQTPLKLRVTGSSNEESPDDDVLFAEDIDKIEAGIGTLYTLGTSLYTSTFHNCVSK